MALNIEPLLTENSRRQLKSFSCPECGEVGLAIEAKLVANWDEEKGPQFALSGAQMKVAMSEMAVVTCPDCGWFAPAELSE